MRFTLIDQITELHLGDRITAVKNLSLAEEYLQDHFPRFPVMPGVLMLEAMFQSCAWLVRVSEDFQNSVVLLKETRNVKFADFVSPGQKLIVSAKIFKQDERLTTLKTQGMLGDNVAVSGRLILDRFNLEDRYPRRGPCDPATRRKFRQQYATLSQGAVITGTLP